MTALPSSAAPIPVQLPLSFGLDTFGDVTHDEDDRPLSHAQTIRNIVEQGSFPTRLAGIFSGLANTQPMTFPLWAAPVFSAAPLVRPSPTNSGPPCTVLGSADPSRWF